MFWQDPKEILFEISHEYKDSGTFTNHDFHGASCLGSREQDFSSTARDWGGKKSLRGGGRLMSWFGYGWWKKSCTNKKKGGTTNLKWLAGFLPSTVDTPQKTNMEPRKDDGLGRCISSKPGGHTLSGSMWVFIFGSVCSQEAVKRLLFPFKTRVSCGFFWLMCKSKQRKRQLCFNCPYLFVMVVVFSMFDLNILGDLYF